jgi:hypothetical protein
MAVRPLPLLDSQKSQKFSQEPPVRWNWYLIWESLKIRLDRVYVLKPERSDESDLK